MTRLNLRGGDEVEGYKRQAVIADSRGQVPITGHTGNPEVISSPVGLVLTNGISSVLDFPTRCRLPITNPNLFSAVGCRFRFGGRSSRTSTVGAV